MSVPWSRISSNTLNVPFSNGLCFTEYPDVKPAIDYAFREVLRERPENPTRFVAEKILEFAGKPIMDPRDREKAQG